MLLTRLNRVFVAVYALSAAHAQNTPRPYLRSAGIARAYRSGMPSSAFTLFFTALFALNVHAMDSLQDVHAVGPSVEFFAEFYSSDDRLRTGAGSHTFARFFKVENGHMTEVADISWMPKPDFLARRNKMPRFATVPGRNYTLEETLGLAEESRATVRQHGRYSISPELFLAAKQQKQKLESGVLKYKLLDSPGSNATNCIHAVTGAVAYLKTGVKHGRTATDAVVNFFLTTGHMSMERRAPSIQTPNPPQYAFEPLQPRSSTRTPNFESSAAVPPPNMHTNRSAPRRAIFRR